MSNFDIDRVLTVTSTSEHTKNVFYVFGEFPNGLKASIRLWPGEKYRGQEYASLLYRVRVSNKPAPCRPQDFEGLVFDRWTGGTLFAEHRSVSGVIRVPRTRYDESHREAFLAKFASASPELHALLLRAFPTLGCTLDAEAFCALVAHQTSVAFPESEFQTEADPAPCVTLSLGDSKGLVSSLRVPGGIVYEALTHEAQLARLGGAAPDAPPDPALPETPDHESSLAPAAPKPHRLNKPKKASATSLNDYAGL